MIWMAIVLLSVGAGWLLGHGDAAANLRVAKQVALVDLLGFLLGANLGLINRDRVRLRRTYSSPALAFLGKLGVFASFAVAATFVLSPVAWPPAMVHASAAGGAAGACLWLGNLPLKL